MVDLEVLRHSYAHIMAEAVSELYPGAKLAIGPAVEDGFYYDMDLDRRLSPDDLPKIEERMREIIARAEPILREEMTIAEAKKRFAGNPYKLEILDGIEGEKVSVYSQGKFSDLCRGPHIKSTAEADPGAFRLVRLAGAYWRGDSKNKMLQRVYGFAFGTKAELDAHLRMLEEAEKRDHRKLGAAMDLFHFEPEYAPGVAFWHPNGWTLVQAMISYLRKKQAAAGYVEVSTPQMMNRVLWETSGHWDKYRENMFTARAEGEDMEYAVRPMNCPGGILIYKHAVRSYRELPVRMAEFGVVDRFESSGSLMGLLRTREFMQDDAHIFCAPDQLEAECLAVVRLIMDIYRDFGFEKVRIKLSTRPEKRLGSDERWDVLEKTLSGALEHGGYGYEVFPGEGAFYGPKLEFVLKDAIGRDWQAGTLQVDMNLPERFGMEYIGPDGRPHTPVMLHRALFGGIGRFIGVLLESTAGRLPLWLSPVQVVLATVTEGANAYASDVKARLESAGVRVQADLSGEKIGAKIRLHSEAKVPIIAVIGARESESGTLVLRRLGSDGQEEVSVDSLIGMVKAAGPAGS
ncbi:MAG: threonine--tRNA ligase [Rickettsiales bacterium]|jgi:threonyl-tRNA synthetase|nr:threonine--tRNA ligase [Rickettsiales bacterium]